MQLKTESGTWLSGEVKIIPAWAWALAAIAFAASQVIFGFFLTGPDAPPPWIRLLLGLLGGSILGCYFLLIGYVNRDSARRGMSALVWTLVAILIPNCLGFLLYFILRQPRRSVCPQCGNSVPAGSNFCPFCSWHLSSSCPRCQHLVGSQDVYCARCGSSLGDQIRSNNEALQKLSI